MIKTEFDVRRRLVLQAAAAGAGALHLPRALAICRALGVDAVGVGDDSVARYESVWRGGVLREYPANVKAVWDVTSRRDAILGPPEPGVRDALAAPG